MQIASTLFWVILIYLAVGLIFAVAFIIKGLKMVDEGAHGSGWGFRLIIIPGIVVFWPLLLRKWIAAVKKEKHD